MHVQDARIQLFKALKNNSIKGVDYCCNTGEIERALMEAYSPKTFDDALDILSYTSNQGPTMVGPEGKFSNLRSLDAWKILFWNYSLKWYK